jgi:hypothetical protein
VTSLVPSLLVLGLAIPCLFVSVNAAALGAIEADRAALGSGLLSTFQWVGGALGLALVAAVSGDAHSHAGAPAGAVVDGVHTGFLACGALGIAALLVTLAGARLRSTAVAVSG